jgi:hypothetical protein
VSLRGLALALGLALAASVAAAGEIELAAEALPLRKNLPRYGINLGGPSAWGAEQLLANILANPGFEPVIERSIILVDSAAGTHFTERDAWAFRPDDFWVGATGKVLTGPATGLTFVIVRQAAGVYAIDRDVRGLAAGDAISIRRTSHVNAAPARWWHEGSVSTVAGSGVSAGTTFARLVAQAGRQARLASYVDTLGRAGRLLPVDGRWRLAFRVRAGSDGNARLRVRFAREGGQVFIDRTISPGRDWASMAWTFDAAESLAGGGPLALSFTVESGSVDLDDTYLGESDPGPGGFRRAVVTTLQALAPGYLRDWQGQLGDTADNRTAPPHQRRPVRYRPGAAEILHTYSAPEFLELAAAVGARPWLILPSTFGVDDAEAFGRRIRVAVDRLKLPEIIIEYGNENWNPLFRPGGIAEPARHGEAAARAFAAFRRGFGGGIPVIATVNARSGDAGGQKALAAAATGADRLAVAPYFAYAPAAGGSLDSALADIFAEAASFPEIPAGLRLAAAEVNLHATGGAADTRRRDAIVAGAAAGPALAARLITGSLAGLREQAAYSLAGFDAFADNGGTVRLFGIVRDLASAGRWRPTGLAVAQLNRITGGDLHRVRCAGTGCTRITAAYFSTAGGAWALINGGERAQPVRLRGACARGMPAGELLDGSSPERTNEDGVTVEFARPMLRCNGADALATLPPFSLLSVRGPAHM